MTKEEKILFEKFIKNNFKMNEYASFKEINIEVNVISNMVYRSPMALFVGYKFFN